MEYNTPQQEKGWVNKSSSVAPGIIGAAAGIFLGDLMHRGARRPVAFSLLCLGVAALTPKVVGSVKQKVAGPHTRRGSQRTLDGILSAGAVDGSEFGEEDMHHFCLLYTSDAADD